MMQRGNKTQRDTLHPVIFLKVSISPLPHHTTTKYTKEKGPNILLKEGSNKKAVRHEKNGHIKQTQRRGNNRPYPQRNYHKTNKKSKYELLKTLVNIKAQKTANTILKA